MKFFDNFEFKPMNILKIVGLVLVAVIFISLAFRLVGSSFNSLFSGLGSTNSVTSEMYSYDKVGVASDLSIRNVASQTIAPNTDDIIIGDNAEEFEVTEYSANIETNKLEKTCDEVEVLKSREDVIFENANKYEKSCNFSFKVKKDSVAEILAIVKALDPKELNENTYTIKRLVDDYTSEAQILQKKMESIEKTLADAIRAYDDVTLLATRMQNVESLAKIIDSKIGIIERLTQEKININAQLERLERAKAEQLDRLDYTYFNVSVLENKFVDGQSLKDSWKTEIKSFVRDINKVFQDITINLVLLLFLILQYVVYLFIILIVAKYGWQLVKYIWKR